MKRLTALMIPMFLAALIAGLAAPAWAQQQPPAQQPPAQQPPAPPAPAPTPAPAAPSPRTIVPGQGLAGISIGTSIRLVIGRFGTPSEVRQTTVDVVYLFNRWGIAVYAKDDQVTAVATTNSLLKMDNVLGVGYRVESAIAAFGRGYKEGPVEGFPGLVYEDRGVAFGMDGTAIAAVLVFRPGTSAAVSGLQAAQAVRGTPPAAFPQVGDLVPFGAQTNYMSLPGYLRWVTYQTSGLWIAYQEAARIVREQVTGQ